MAQAFLNNCGWYSAAGGTADFVYSSEATYMYSPANCLAPAVITGATYHYLAFNGAEHEEGTGVWTVATSTLTRATIRNSSTGAKIDFTDPPQIIMGGPVAADEIAGPATSTDNAIPRWDGTTGWVLQDSGVIIDDSDNITGVVDLTLTNDLLLGAGSLINWNASDITITHVANALTFQGGNFAFGAATATDFGGTNVDIVHASGFASQLWSSGSVIGEVLVHTSGIVSFGARSNHSLRLLVNDAIVLYVATGAIHGVSNDAVALGTSSTAFSDLFLASGGVINWNAGEYAISQSGTALTFAADTTNTEFANFLNAGLANGEYNYINIGKAISPNNCCFIGFYQDASSSRMFFGLYGDNPINSGGGISIDKGGAVGMGIAVATAQLHVKQPSVTGGYPAAAFEQADISEELFHFLGSASESTADQTLVDAVTDFGQAGALLAYVKCKITDAGSRIGAGAATDGWIPVHYIPTEA